MKHKYKKGQYIKIINIDKNNSILNMSKVWKITYINSDGTYDILPASFWMMPEPRIEEKYIRKLNIFEYLFVRVKGFRIRIKVDF